MGADLTCSMGACTPPPLHIGGASAGLRLRQHCACASPHHQAFAHSSLPLHHYQLTLMAPTELQPAADGTERFAQGLAGFERTAIKIHLGTCPVRADQAPRKPDEKPAIKVITVDGPLSRINVRGGASREQDWRLGMRCKPAGSQLVAGSGGLTVPPKGVGTAGPVA
mgnify:CR=1 FL=1